MQHTIKFGTDGWPGKTPRLQTCGGDKRRTDQDRLCAP